LKKVRKGDWPEFSWRPGDLSKPGNEPGSPTLQADSLPYEPLGKLIPRDSIK